MPSPLVARLSDEAIGSPHLMQEFCRSAAKSYMPIGKTINLDEEALEFIFKGVADTIGRPIFEKLASGPRQRTDRVRRALVDGTDVDIYELVLHGLSQLNPDLATYEYEDLRSGIRQVSAETIPHLITHLSQACQELYN